MKRVQIYRNLHKPGFFTAQSCMKDTYGLKIGEGKFMVIDDAKFVVRPGGLKKTRETGQRNVHAFVRGNWVNEDQSEKWLNWFRMNEYYMRPVYYNPHKVDSFIDTKNGQPIHNAWRVFALGSRVYVIDECWKTPMHLSGMPYKEAA